MTDDKKPTRGGRREGSGPKLKGAEKRIKISASIDAEGFRRIEAERMKKCMSLSSFVSSMAMMLPKTDPLTATKT